MSLKDRQPPIALLSARLLSAVKGHHDAVSDTDPRMLFALWDMEEGIDPDDSLDSMEGAVVLYDKFASRLARRSR